MKYFISAKFSMMWKVAKICEAEMNFILIILDISIIACICDF